MEMTESQRAAVARLSPEDRRLNIESRLLARLSNYGGSLIVAGPMMESLIRDLADEAERLADRMGANLTCDGCRILREIEDPDPCCARPNMVWEHSRAGKERSQLPLLPEGCGGGMTKARATDG